MSWMDEAQAKRAKQSQNKEQSFQLLHRRFNAQYQAVEHHITRVLEHIQNQGLPYYPKRNELRAVNLSLPEFVIYRPHCNYHNRPWQFEPNYSLTSDIKSATLSKPKYDLSYIWTITNPNIFGASLHLCYTRQSLYLRSGYHIAPINPNVESGSAYGLQQSVQYDLVRNLHGNVEWVISTFGQTVIDSSSLDSHQIIEEVHSWFLYSEDHPQVSL
jgi:hypothetical protein